MKQEGNYIVIKIKTIWMGKIGIRDRYIEEAKKRFKDLLIVKGNDVMVIPYEKIDELEVGRSEFPVVDKFDRNKGGHFLIYYNWKPTTIQPSLF